MGSVIVQYRVLPDGPERSATVRQSLEQLKPEKLVEEPLAFGLVAFRFFKVIPDSPGTEEQLERQVESLPHIQTVETISVTRSL